MVFHLLPALLSAAAALFLLMGTAPRPLGAFISALFSLWFFFRVRRRPSRSQPPPILRLGGFSWQLEDFCRGWLITGQVGSGKTQGAINAMLWQVSRNCPTWGGICIDDKGLYWETLQGLLGQLGRRDDLILLQVRPDPAPRDWRPSHTFNFLDYPYLPFSAKAKIVCDVAASLGQRTEQSFFRIQAQVHIEFAFRVLAAKGGPITLDEAYTLLTSAGNLAEIMNALIDRKNPDHQDLIAHYQENFESQPPEQLGGVRSTIANYLKYFTDPHIAEVFCPTHSSFDFEAVDRGKIICLSMPQRFQTERRYINTLLKLTFYAHALRRFDKTAEVRSHDNLLILWADEAQKIVTAADDGMSDYNVVDVIREARATVVAATQSYQSLMPPMGDEKKAKVFIANMANRITFRAADEESARIAADAIGKRVTKKRTYGYSGGRKTLSWTDEEKYWLEPHQFRRLLKFQAVVQHCNGGFRRAVLPPIGRDGLVPSWYRA